MEPGLSGRALARAVRAARSSAGKGGPDLPARTEPAPAEGVGVDRPADAEDAVTSGATGKALTGTAAAGGGRVTGDRTVADSRVTGTDYIRPGAAQESERAGGARRLTGSVVGRSERVTGDEAGADRRPTGTPYQPVGQGRAPAKVGHTVTFRGATVSGTRVGRSMRVTGDEPGSCRRITGNEYVGSEQFRELCTTTPPARPPATGRSTTSRGLALTGSLPGRGARVTGNERGTCEAVTGTPYDGSDQLEAYCEDEARAAVDDRTRAGRATPGASLTGLQPGLNGAVTGAERGACEPLTGTPYVGEDQFEAACGPSTRPGDDSRPGRFSIVSPAGAAREAAHAEAAGGRRRRVTGPFGMADGKVTGSDEIRLGGPGAGGPPAGQPPVTPAPRVGPRVTGEGLDAGLRITGDDWDRGERVTGTEGSSSTVRNPTRRGGPTGAMTRPGAGRREPQDLPDSPVTGGAGATARGALVTVSGGARG